ncbi:hypothetical protein HPB50_006605 [Hyalomma asiaticum]|uniref:Uncharacterized protein n=1 Tax=Hyalomma asiaticum TaxID=266040 RepID=A0ACB7S801_HYAAI|nr:hypothetical protein HPB50_006605 [Hyalomma asiaticum]
MRGPGAFAPSFPAYGGLLSWDWATGGTSGGSALFALLSLCRDETRHPAGSRADGRARCVTRVRCLTPVLSHCRPPGQVTSRERSWTLRRSYDNFRLLDEQLHRCVYDRQHSRLPELPDPADLPQEPQDREVGGLATLVLFTLASDAGLIRVGNTYWQTLRPSH